MYDNQYDCDCEKQKHVHFLKDFTEEKDGHKHEFRKRLNIARIE